ncbi:DHH family phosphoesterase [Allostreptomyces psammosilenae]|uniref:Phosphoesterase RecJ-like protein n=1 Tax=Allostreptomyces psammosilenae TaxID=1892865 RepID=A0A853A2T4_9ACTN|nr:bifunctional oligoribonuclease/PAP phosphatase NrnA [Allostreptomyces psammosilenae]NYI08447.1 phosphoesterase RecJ-like protein [Allostreptomyces psammosilenae]
MTTGPGDRTPHQGGDGPADDAAPAPAPRRRPARLLPRDVLGATAVPPPEPPGTPGAPAAPAERAAGAGPVRPGERDWERVADLFREAGSAVLLCHVAPDGDALGSALAMALGLSRIGVEAVVSFGEDPQVVPESLSFLPGQEFLVPPAQVPENADLVAVFDVASPDRLGLLRGAALTARRLVVVDHHASNDAAATGFGTDLLIDPTAPATAVLVDELLRRLGVPLTAPIAACLYTGVATDTGSFRYAATTPATHELAARLLATGIRHDLMARALWDTSSFGTLKVLAAALDRAVLEPGAAGGLGLVWTVVPRADRERHGVEMAEVEGFIDTLRRTAEAEVALVLKEDDSGALLGSSRSKGAVDVGRVCGGLGGGGHALAAGFTSPKSDVAATVEAFRGLLEEAVAPGGGPGG